MFVDIAKFFCNSVELVHEMWRL